VHAVNELTVVVPEGHGEQVRLDLAPLIVENVPARQRVEAVPVGQYEPATHVEHDVNGVIDEFPAGHGRQ
jgi:hypothetical protein